MAEAEGSQHGVERVITEVSLGAGIATTDELEWISRIV